ncbi:hypothetical protein [Azohydromonas aeria]|uniref:hypothetical protein n=1 Tax=Azohydromonas aeria TaxID=2590212 RepID=UPI0012FBB094|nr:hypothetical protein [Azohydromonas aeria]
MPATPAEHLSDLIARIALYPGGPMLGRAAVAACLALAAAGASLEWLDTVALPAWQRIVEPPPNVAGPPVPAAVEAVPVATPAAAAAESRRGSSSVRVLSTHVLADAAGEATLTLQLRRGAEAQVQLRVEGAEIEAADGPVRLSAPGAAAAELLGSGTVRLSLQDLRPARALRLRLVDAHGQALDAAGTAAGVELAVLAPPAAAAPLTVALAR